MRLFLYLLWRWMRKILRYLNASDYIAGTLAISAMGVCRDFAAQLAQSLCDWLVRRLWVTVRLHEKDADLLLAWLRERPEIHGTSELWLYAKRGEGKSTRYEYEPEICYTTRVRCQGKAGGQWLWVTREARENGEAKAKVSFLGHDKGLLEGILQEGKEIQRRKREQLGGESEAGQGPQAAGALHLLRGLAAGSRDRQGSGSGSPGRCSGVPEL
ncbi:unnamed protein product [Effrenium voratum]|nr:unnamed protein product [Effrenium voratum]